MAEPRLADAHSAPVSVDPTTGTHARLAPSQGLPGAASKPEGVRSAPLLPPLSPDALEPDPTELLIQEWMEEKRAARSGEPAPAPGISERKTSLPSPSSSPFAFEDDRSPEGLATAIDTAQVLADSVFGVSDDGWGGLQETMASDQAHQRAQEHKALVETAAAVKEAITPEHARLRYEVSAPERTFGFALGVLVLGFIVGVIILVWVYLAQMSATVPDVLDPETPIVGTNSDLTKYRGGPRG